VAAPKYTEAVSARLPAGVSIASSAAAPSGRTRRGARTRERILEAATEVFARRGFHGARVADIAEQAGIAYGLVYHHFRNKDDILAAIFSERWGRHMDYLSELVEMRASFREKLSRLVHFWIETYRTEPHLMTVLINEISRSYEFLESHDIEAVLVAFDSVELLIEQGRASGELRSDVDARFAAYAVLGVAEMVLTGYVMGTLKRTGRELYTRDEQQLVALLYEGLAAGEASPG
jgi:TetR/AcrR family fatty acid metabolism transcriptional regulator